MRRSRIPSKFFLIVCIAILAGCSILPQTQEGKSATEALTLGVSQYDAGRYDESLKTLQSALEMPAMSKKQLATAHKYSAFIHCASKRETACRDHFRKAFEVDSGFELTAAEAGHPSWGPVFSEIKEQRAVAASIGFKPGAPLTKSRQMLADGRVSYERGKFAEALKLLQAALKEGLQTPADQIMARKYSAFSLCLLGRQKPCSEEFQKIFVLDPKFDLTPGEAGHPAWMKVFPEAKKRALAVPPAKKK